jgi:hypothetical protein
MAAVLPQRGITGLIPQNPEIDDKPLNTDRSPYFTFMWNHARWDVFPDPDNDANYVFLPVLGTLKRDPGLGSVDKNGSTTLAKAARGENGWVEIDTRHCHTTDTPDGQPGYVRMWRARNGIRHGCAWETPRVVGNRVHWSIDEAGYRRWLKRLVTDGVIAQPDPAVIETILEVVEQRVERSRGRAMNNPHAAELLRDAEKRLAAIRAAAIPGSEPEKTPKRRGA